MNREKWAKNARIRKGVEVVVLSLPHEHDECACGRRWFETSDPRPEIGCTGIVDDPVAGMSDRCKDSVQIRVGDNRYALPFWCLTRGTA